MKAWYFSQLGLFVVSVLLTVLIGAILLPILKRLHVGQTVRVEGPKTHYKKSGTPTIGGLMFLLPLLVTTGFAAGYAASADLAAIALFVLGLALTGFLDDYIKVKRDKKGLSPGRKTLPMLLVIAAFVLYYCFFRGVTPQILWPLTAQFVDVTGIWLYVYAAFLIVFSYFTINAVNLTDGVDGLLATLTIPVLLSLWIIVALPPVGGLIQTGHGSRLLAYPLTALAGGLLGFLHYNRHPARIFMGDTGSLAVGTLFTAMLILMGLPWLLFFQGLIYLLEALSVVIQVTYFKVTHGKRIFRMSPIHHHFELGGWSEKKIVRVFTLIAASSSVIGLLLLLPAFLGGHS